MPDSQSIPEAALEVIESDGTRHLVRVTHSPFLIGRGEESGNHLKLSDQRVSRRAAALVHAESVFRVEDRGQRHGLFVNGEKTDDRPLQEGDVITLGTGESLRLIFHTGRERESFAQVLHRLEQASAEEPASRDLRPLSLLLEATTLLQSSLPVEDVLGEMVERAIGVTGAERGLLLEARGTGELSPLVARQQDGRSLRVEAVQASQTALRQALEKQRSVVEEDTAQARTALRKAQSVVDQRLRSVIAIPLYSRVYLHATDTTTEKSVRGEVLGVLYLDSRRPAAFSRLERQILDALAHEAASVLDNARLMQNEQERRRLEQELDIARSIQQRLLPRGFQRTAYLEVAGANQPCRTVGGDYFDVMSLGPDHTAFVIADVCGKGLGAALLTAMLQGSLSAIPLGQEPAAILANLNQYVVSRSEPHHFATLFLGVLDAAGRLEWSNAGHLAPLLLCRDCVQPAFSAGSVPLGLFPNEEYKTSSAQLEPGDTLILFTDGITEAVNLQEEEFGLNRLQEVAGRHAREPVEELHAAILAAVAEFTQGTPQADDITLLIVRRPAA
ncbi:MAG: SpoIIE family protein phosphatase [Terriglobia bacterium]